MAKPANKRLPGVAKGKSTIGVNVGTTGRDADDAANPKPGGEDARRHHEAASTLAARIEKKQVRPEEQIECRYDLVFNAKEWARLAGKELGHRSLATEFNVEKSAMKYALHVYERFKGEEGRKRLLGLKFKPREFPSESRKPKGRKPPYSMLVIICAPKWEGEFEELLELALKENWSEKDARTRTEKRPPKATRSVPSPSGVLDPTKVDLGGRSRAKLLAAKLRAIAKLVAEIGQVDPPTAGRDRRVGCYDEIEKMAKAIESAAESERKSISSEATNPEASMPANSESDVPA